MNLESFLGEDSSQKTTLTAIAPAARSAIKQEIIPQIEEGVFSVELADDLAANTKRAIESAFSYKNELYSRLISHKGIDQSDQQFLQDLLLVLDEWARMIKKTLTKTHREELTSEVVFFNPSPQQEYESDTKLFDADTASAMILAFGKRAQDQKIKVNDFVSGQEPNPDEGDEDWAADVEIQIMLEGRRLAQFLGVQERVLDNALKKLTPDRLLLRLANDHGKVAAEIKREILKQVTSWVKRENNSRVITLDYTESRQYWQADLDTRNRRVVFTVEVGVLGKWT